MKQLFTLFFICLSLTSFGQTINDVFKTMPDDMLPGLSEADRTMLLVDTKLTTVPYALGNIEKQIFTDTYLRIKTSDIGTLQIKLLPTLTSEKWVCVIKTACSKACDSDIKFYTTNWEPLATSAILPPISVHNFLDVAKSKTTECADAVKLMDFTPISASFGNDTDALTLTLNYQSYMTKENAAKIKPFFKEDSITLQWNKKSFQ